MENPADPYAPQREIIPCCQHLRTKTQCYMPDEMRAGPGTIKVTTTGTYWCERTHHARGPDALRATPHQCQAGRACYERDA